MFNLTISKSKFKKLLFITTSVYSTLCKLIENIIIKYLVSTNRLVVVLQNTGMNVNLTKSVGKNIHERVTHVVQQNSCVFQKVIK